MGNESFLFRAYFTAGAICACLGLSACLWLRRPLGKITDRIPRRGWTTALKRSFPATILLMAFSGFLSVSYYGCTVTTYKDIVSNRGYILTVGGEQISKTMSSIVLAVFIWAVVVVVSLKVDQRHVDAGNQGSDPSNRE